MSITGKGDVDGFKKKFFLIDQQLWKNKTLIHRKDASHSAPSLFTHLRAKQHHRFVEWDSPVSLLASKTLKPGEAHNESLLLPRRTHKESVTKVSYGAATSCLISVLGSVGWGETSIIYLEFLA